MLSNNGNSNFCDKCQKSFSNSSALHRHERLHNASDQFECDECHKGFKLKSSLKRHQLHNHQNVKQHKCTNCNASFAQRSNLQAHQRRLHNRITNFKCPECDGSFFKSIYALNRHRRSRHVHDQRLAATPPKPADDPSSFAEFVVTQLKSLEQGISALNVQQQAEVDAAVTTTEAHETTSIDAAVLHETNLNVRLNPERISKTIKVQTIKRPRECLAYICEYCAKEFHKTYNLIRHLRSHTNERPYDCSVCSASFKTKTSLNLHFKNLHILNEETGLIGYVHKCYICDMNFSSMRKLDLHMNVHAENYVVHYYCNVCHCSFSKKAAFSCHKHKAEDKELAALEDCLPEPITLKTKLKTFHIKSINKLYKCSNCGLEQRTKEDLNKHMKHHELIRKFKCKSCGSTFKSNLTLRVHQKKLHKSTSETEKPLTCSLCTDRNFKTKYQLERHNRHVHSTERNYQCQYCDLKFKNKTHCKSHMRSFHLKKLLGPITEPALTPSNETRTVDIIVEKTTGANSANNPLAKFIKIEMLNKYPKLKNQNIRVEQVTAASPSNRVDSAITQLNPLSHVCSHCDKIFKKPSDLVRHQRLHTKERPFACDSCKKSFKLKSTLNDHQKTHLDQIEKRKLSMPCQVCGKLYATQKSLNIHLRLHTGAFPFRCEFCSKGFRTSGNRLAHLKAAKHRNGKCSALKNIFQNK